MMCTRRCARGRVGAREAKRRYSSVKKFQMFVLRAQTNEEPTTQMTITPNRAPNLLSRNATVMAGVSLAESQPKSHASITGLNPYTYPG
jgi:hypothetical protein